MSVKWTKLCVSKSATTLLEVMSANVKMGISLWQEPTGVKVQCLLATAATAIYIQMLYMHDVSWQRSNIYYNCVAQQTDIDECDLREINDCQQHCTNTVGSFNCSCQEGFTLNVDGRNCDGRYKISLYCMSYKNGSLP